MLTLDEKALRKNSDKYLISLTTALHISLEEALGSMTASGGATFKEPDEWRFIHNEERTTVLDS